MAIINNIDILNIYDDCETCLPSSPSYRLVDCSNSENIININWAGNTLLDESKTYVFNFDLNTCWTPVFTTIQFVGVPIYGNNDVNEIYDDCVTCNKVCYRLIDCDSETADVLTSDITFQDYVGKIIKWKDEVDIEHCATVVTYLCREEPPTDPEITIISCYRDCTRCEESLTPEPEVLPIEFTIQRRPVKPNYTLAICSMDYYNNVQKKFSEALFQEMVSLRYGIEFCCEIDKLKYSIKKELMELQILEATYADPNEDNTLISCNLGVGIGYMQIDNDSCNIFKVYPEV